MLMKWLPAEPLAEHKNKEMLARIPTRINWDADVIAML